MIPPSRETLFTLGNCVWKGRIRSLKRMTNAQTLRTSIHSLNKYFRADDSKGTGIGTLVLWIFFGEILSI